VDLFKKNVQLSGWGTTVFADYVAQKIVAWVPEITASRSGTSRPRILDFGCGDGVLTSFLDLRLPHAEVVGVDPTLDAIEVARMAYPTIEFFVSEHTVPFQDRSFDLVVAANVFHHIPSREHEHYLREIDRVLKPQGICVLVELNPLNPYTHYTFRRNPTEQDARMLYPFQVVRMLKRYGSTQLKFGRFFTVYGCIMRKNGVRAV
jgi:ubiquinone/menaquinone biosynthesis C-methylase UbiE